MFAEPLQQVDRVYVRSKGRKLLYFGGCDYLRLSSDPSVVRAVEAGMRRWGLNVAASRMTTGNHSLYETVEGEIADFFKAEAAVLTSNGYLTNMVVAQGLSGEIKTVLVDERSHVSMLDALLLLKAKVVLFPHRDPRAFAARLKTMRDRDGLAILTDGMFSHDGSLAPLKEYREIAGEDAFMWVDDSHGAGILGRSGKGTVEISGLQRRNLIQTVTFSKGFGVYGGAVVCERAIRDLILEKSRIMVGNTPLPLPLVSGISKALSIVKRGGRSRERLRANVETFYREQGEILPREMTPIVSVVPTSRRRAEALREKLLKNAIYPTLIQYPGGPEGGYFRFAISSEHTHEQVKKLGRVVAES